MKLFEHPLSKFNKEINQSGKLLDVGSLNFSQYKRIKESHPLIEHHGIDYCEPTEKIPIGFTFKLADLNKNDIPYENDYFDYVIASHIIEHLSDPLNFFKECMRVLKPNGLLYIEAPSERSLRINGNKKDLHKMLSFNLYDDPTHSMRPWTPQSFYRLAKYYGCNSIKTEHIISWKIKVLFPVLYIYSKILKNRPMLEKIIWLKNGWAVYMIATKEYKGSPKFNYFIPERNI